MRGLLLVIACAGCRHDHTWRDMRRPATSPDGFCTALQKDDYGAAEAALETKLASLGSRGDDATEEMVRAWLQVQPCIVAVEREPCSPGAHHRPVIDVRWRRGRARIYLYASGTARVDKVTTCT